MREIQDLCEAVFHVERPNNDAQDAQHAWLPGESQSYKIGHWTILPRAGDFFGCLLISINLSAAIAEPLLSLVDAAEAPNSRRLWFGAAYDAPFCVFDLS